MTKLFISRRDILMNMTLFLFYVHATYGFILDYIATARLTSLIFIIFLTHFAALSLIRKSPVSFTKKPIEWLVAIGGTTATALLHPAGNLPVPLGVTLQLVGLLITLTGLFSLNRSFAIVPANRGIKTSGLYRVVRHPLYAGYILSDMGFIISQFSYYNLLVSMVAIGLLLLRIRYEEAFLRQDPEYVAFCTTTRYRIIPYIW